QALMPYRSTAFEMDAAAIARILSLNPAIYEDIQFGNPHTVEMLDRLLRQLQQLRTLVGAGDDASRAAFRRQFLTGNREAIDAATLQEGNYSFERLGYLLADLSERRAISVHLPEDRAGSLRELLHVFERHGISLASIHSSRTPAGEVHFRIGFDHEYAAEIVEAAAAGCWNAERAHSSTAGVDELRTNLWMNAGSRCGTRLSRGLVNYSPATMQERTLVRERLSR